MFYNPLICRASKAMHNAIGDHITKIDGNKKRDFSWIGKQVLQQ